MIDTTALGADAPQGIHRLARAWRRNRRAERTAFADRIAYSYCRLPRRNPYWYPATPELPTYHIEPCPECGALRIP